MSRRQTGGGETWRRLLEWDRGQAYSERLAAQILRVEGYQSIDPSHPLGGRDGLKDLVCEKDGIKFIGASYFPRGKQGYTRIEEKFKNDLGGVKHNSADGIAFVTNQEMTLSERENLISMAGSIKVDLFHLERIASILDSVKCYGLRLEFLDIEMNKEEQLAFMAIMSQSIDNFNKFMSVISRSDILRKEWKTLIADQESVKSPQYVESIFIENTQSLNPLKPGNKFNRCSLCGYGYIALGLSDSPTSVTNIWTVNPLFSRRISTCPKCGNADEI